MIEQYKKVKEFQTAFGQPVASELTDLSLDRIKLRSKILQEEVAELNEALLDDNYVEVADAITDCIYILLGTAIEVGITGEQLEQCFAEVHRSNMSKLDDNGKPVLRADGKITKGANYSAPNLKPIIK